MKPPSTFDQLSMMINSQTKGERANLLGAHKTMVFLSLEKAGLMYADAENGLIWMTDKGKYLLKEIEHQFNELSPL